MKLIQLYNGKTAKVDDKDYERLSKFAWHIGHRGYVVTSVSYGPVIYMHHMVLGFPPKGKDCSHIDHDKTNNQEENLVFVSKSVNLHHRNGKKPFSGFYGVCINWRDGKFTAQIQKDRVRFNLGTFITPEAAARAYDAKARKLYGLDANLNFPDEHRSTKSGCSIDTFVEHTEESSINSHE